MYSWTIVECMGWDSRYTTTKIKIKAVNTRTVVKSISSYARYIVGNNHNTVYAVAIVKTIRRNSFNRVTNN